MTKYESPRMTRIGTVQQLTQQLNLTNSDSPQGTPDTAFPVAS